MSALNKYILEVYLETGYIIAYKTLQNIFFKETGICIDEI